jgi:hypothetical protein
MRRDFFVLSPLKKSHADTNRWYPCSLSPTDTSPRFLVSRLHLAPLKSRSTMKEMEEKVVAELRAQRVKLWLPPYVNTDQSPNRASLYELSKRLSSSVPDCTNEDVQSAILSLQTHALEKLRQKKQSAAIRTSLSCLEIKILGLTTEDMSHSDAPKTWAERIELQPKALKLWDVKPHLTVATFAEELMAMLKVSSVRLIHRGKSISLTDTRFLVEVLGTTSCDTTTMLCLVSSDSAPQELSPDHSLVDSIRRAALKLASADFEVTDQHGKHVSMLPTDRLAFLTALGLHSLGKSRMQNNQTLSSALVFLLEADQEWNIIATEWRDKVDNYGLLQLDIAWIHLKLQSFDSLEHVTRRLEVAEVVLRKQVHTNFVTLALVQSEMGNAVPPLAAVFCRLFLLQGVAYHYSHDADKSKERLDWAWALCSSLRAVSSPEAVTSLCDAVGVTESQAISALRRSEGNLNQAAELISRDKADALQQEERRTQQRKLGLCQNTMDYVDLDLLPTLQSILGGLDFQVAAGLLRLANNDLEKALDLYQDMERNTAAVLQRASALDQDQGRRKRSRDDDDDGIAVDEVGLATLVSMGVDESIAKKALGSSQNNVEMALLWLTRKSDDESHASNEDETINSEQADETHASNEDETINGDEADENWKQSIQEQESEEAKELLERELGEVLQERDLEKEYLGSTLDEEWVFLVQFRAN